MIPAKRLQAHPLIPAVPAVTAPPPAVPVAQAVTVNVIQPSKGVNHVLHLLLTIVTAGLWLPVWIILIVTHR